MQSWCYQNHQHTLKMQSWCYQNHQHTLKMETKLGTETSGNLHILTRLTARENFIEFCGREGCKTTM